MPRILAFPTVAIGLTLLTGPVAHAAPGPAAVQNPSYNPNPQRVRIDLRPDAQRSRPLVNAGYEARPSFDQLDDYMNDAVQDTPVPAEPVIRELEGGMVQIGSVVVPREMLEGAEMVSDVEATLHAANPSQTQADNHTIEEFCAFPEEVPAGIYDRDPRPGEERPRFHTVFLNFNGGTLATGGENSAENISNIARTGHPYPVYAGGETLAIAAAQAVQADFDQWAVRVAYIERPAKVLPYTMVMMGGDHSDTTAGPSGGVAPLDCEDWGQRNVCYMFQDGGSATGQANIASQEIGHTIGLGHTQASDSVMAAGYAPTQAGDLGFNDTCAPTINVADQGAKCSGVNRCHCGVPDQQQDHNTMFAAFAPAGVDIVEPTIELTTPADGSEFAVDEPILVTFDPWDDHGGFGWKLIVEDENGEVLVDQVDYERALEFELVGLPVGTYTLTGHVQDHADQIGTHTIQVTVVEAQADSDTEGGTDGDTDGGVETTDGAATGVGDTESMDTQESGAGETAGQDATDEGCGCRLAPSQGPIAYFGSMLLLGLARRRRRV